MSSFQVSGGALRNCLPKRAFGRREVGEGHRQLHLLLGAGSSTYFSV
jgi:hypothetical protein